MPETTESSEKCPHCGSTSLYEAQANARGQGLDLLPGLGGFWKSGMFRVVVCSECGATQFFADEKSRAELSQNGKWKRL